MATNIVRQYGAVTRTERARLLGQTGTVVWLTGLSGSGKSTIAYALERRLLDLGKVAFPLDGDNVRHGLSKDLNFSPEDRTENIRRIGEVAALFADAGFIAITSFISPYRSDRNVAREVVGSDRFIEIHLDTPIEVCEQRDPKGLYRKARAGEILNFTGVDAPYERPDAPSIVLPTAETDIDQCVDIIIDYLREHNRLEAP